MAWLGMMTQRPAAPELISTTQGDPHRWKILGIGVAANASFAAVFQGLPTTAVLMRADHKLTNDQLGLAFGLLGLGIAVSEIPWGLLTDRWGDRSVLLIGLGLTSVALVLFTMFASPTPSHVPSAWALALGLLVVGCWSTGRECQWVQWTRSDGLVWQE